MINLSEDGKFELIIDSTKLSRGLRPAENAPRNSEYLIECLGAVGSGGVLQIVDELTRINTSTITDAFPYPQIFVFTNLIIVCSQTVIYEWVSSALVSKLTVAAGSTWSAVDFFEYIYLSNGKVAVVRDHIAKTYAETSDLPVVSSICNFNGQVLVGAPSTVMPGGSLTIKAGAITVTITQLGTMTVA